MPNRSLLLNLCISSWLVANLANAQDTAASEADPTPDTNYAARARVRSPIAATNPEDATAAATTIDVRDRSSALESVDEVVDQVPGSRVQRTGGFGSFSGVALRGAGYEHTSVLFGDLPLNTTDTGPFDLSLIPLSMIDSVEIYRGGAPVWWSDGAVGGVIRLVPRSAERSFLQAKSGVGSYGHLELGASSSVVRNTGRKPTLFTHVDFARADNDYAYVDDGQTRFDTEQGAATDDDVTRRQRNADIEAANGLAHLGFDLWGGRLDFVVLGHERNLGIPGPLAAPTVHVRRRVARALGAISWTKEQLRGDGKRIYRVQALASGNYQNTRLTDLDSELGISRSSASDNAWSRAYARMAGSVAVLPWLEPTLVASVARDDYRPRDPLAFTLPPRASGRSSEALALEARLHGELGDTRLELRPSVRGQWSQTSIWAGGNTAASSTRERNDDVVATYRIAGVVAPWPAVAFSASASTGVRLPSILELFGDGVFQQANPQLSPEHSRAFDLGTVVRGRAGDARGSAELRGFALYIDDLIGYRRTAQYTVHPENIDSARVLGGELGVQGNFGRHLGLSSSITVMQTRNQFDRSLPLRPPLQVSARPELTLYPSFADRTIFFVEAEHVSFVYLDPANRTFLDGRTIFSVGASLQFLQRHMTLAARAQNLFDVQATDVLSRPLPGFNFLLSLTVEDSID